MSCGGGEGWGGVGWCGVGWGGVVWGGVVWGEYLGYCDTLNNTEQGLYRIFCWGGGGRGNSTEFHSHNIMRYRITLLYVNNTEGAEIQ